MALLTGPGLRKTELYRAGRLHAMRASRFVHVCLLACAFSVSDARFVRAQDLPATEVDTADQARGVAPRLDLEIGLHFAWGFGDPCRRELDVRTCTGSFPILGGQLLVELRPWNHIAFGPVLAYDHWLGSDSLRIASEGTVDYSRHLWRLLMELRWYSRRVQQGGFFIDLRAGVAWMTDTFSPSSGGSPDVGATQTAPVVGFGFGGAFLPYRGLGATLALQGFVAPFSKQAEDLPGSVGAMRSTAYAYGLFAFAGLTLSLSIGAGL